MAYRKRVLIVEDEETFARLVKWQLEMRGLEVHTASCGMAALRDAAVYPPDLIILDVGLPDINGYEVCRELRKLHQPWLVPVMMLTGRDQPADQLRGFAYGAEAYLTKPCESSELLKTVSLLLGDTVPT